MERYEKPEMEIIELDEEDIITASSDETRLTDFTGSGYSPENPNAWRTNA